MAVANLLIDRVRLQAKISQLEEAIRDIERMAREGYPGRQISERAQAVILETRR
jgi:hypothetical protein